jgi:hypothetical protein
MFCTFRVRVAYFACVLDHKASARNARNSGRGSKEKSMSGAKTQQLRDASLWRIGSKLRQASDQDLSRLLASAQPLYAGIGGTAAVALLDAVAAVFLKSEPWDAGVRAYLSGSRNDDLPHAVAAAVRRHGPAAMTFLDSARAMRDGRRGELQDE